MSDDERTARRVRRAETNDAQEEHEHADQPAVAQGEQGQVRSSETTGHIESVHLLQTEVNLQQYATGLNLIPEFNGKNWEIFRRKLETQFIRMGIETYLEFLPGTSTAEIRNDRIAYAEVTMRLSQLAYKQIASCRYTKDVWAKLCEIYDEKKDAQASTKFVKFIEDKKSSTETVKIYLDRLIETYHDLITLGINMGEIALCAKALHGLSQDYEQAKAAARASEIKTIAKLTNLLLATEREKIGNKPKSSDDAQTPELKALKTLRKKTNGQRKKKHCTKCSQDGHDNRECWHLHPELKPDWLKEKEKNRTKSSAVLANFTDPDEFKGFRVVTFSNASAIDGFLIDSGANVSITKDRAILQNYQSMTKPVFIQACNGQVIKAAGKGTLVLSTEPLITLPNVLYVPSATNTLISAHTLTKLGLTIVIKDHMHIKTADGETILTAKMKNGLYTIAPLKSPTMNAFETITLEQAHHRFGHASDERLKNIGESTVGIKITGEERPFCDTCAQNKSRRKPFPEERRTKPTRQYEIVSSDLKGPFLEPGPEGYRYYIPFNCLFSTWTWITFLKTKSAEEVLDALQRFMTDAQAETKERMTTLLTDGGGEYVNNLMSVFLLQKGIKHQRTVPYCPQQNGQAERRNLTIMQMARCVLTESNLPNSYWTFAVRYAVFTLNRLPTKRIQWKTPYELWCNQTPEVEQLRRFGCIAWANIDKSFRTSIDSTAEKCIFLGYPQYQKGYVLQRFADKRILIRHAVTFNESQFTDQQRTRDEDNHEQMEIIDEFVYATNNTISQKLPKSFKEPMKTPEAQQWYQAAFKEMAAHEQNQTWTLVDPPDDIKPITGRWVFTEKTDAAGQMQHKTRYVAKGYSQRFGVDYDETFSSVLAHTSLRVLLATATHKKWKIFQKDFTTAYLNAPLDESLYMLQPEGFEKPGAENKLCLLKKALYGLKQAGRQWQKTLFDKIRSINFTQSRKEPCLWYKSSCRNQITMIAIYVDDLLITGDDQDEILKVSQVLARSFRMKDLGIAKNFLGMELSYPNNGILLTQRRYIREVIATYRQEHCKHASTPMTKPYEAGDDDEETNQYPIREAIGCLQYLANATRPDIAYAVNNISRHISKPTKTLWHATQRIIKYLKGTANEGILFKSNPLEIISWADSSYGPDPNDRRSVTGILITLGENPIIWKSKKQGCIALSTTEAEYIAACSATKEVIWLQDLLIELRLLKQVPKTMLYQDNQGALFIEKNDCSSQRSKHIDIQYHYVRDMIKEQRIDVQYVPTNNMVADILTKPLNERIFKRLKVFLTNDGFLHSVSQGAYQTMR